jgi:hypothetical protein
MSEFIIRTDAGAMANSAAVVAHSIMSPGTTLVIEKAEPAKTEAALAPPVGGGAEGTRYPPSFNYILLYVIILTLLCLAGMVLLAQYWPENPTDFQKTAFQAMDFGFKGGAGASFGLLKGRHG